MLAPPYSENRLILLDNFVAVKTKRKISKQGDAHLKNLVQTLMGLVSSEKTKKIKATTSDGIADEYTIQ